VLKLVQDIISSGRGKGTKGIELEGRLELEITRRPNPRPAKVAIRG
jgi:hypothetical protein